MKKFLILISLIVCSNVLLAQFNGNWTMHLNYASAYTSNYKHYFNNPYLPSAIGLEFAINIEM